jgi:hypothetical protein
MIPLRADPERGVLIGWVVLLTGLFPPVLLLVLIVAAVLDHRARSGRHRSGVEVEAEYADRFQELEASILDQGEQTDTPPTAE